MSNPSSLDHPNLFDCYPRDNLKEKRNHVKVVLMFTKRQGKAIGILKPFFLYTFYWHILPFHRNVLQKNLYRSLYFFKNFQNKFIRQKSIYLQFFSTSAKIPNAVFPMLRVIFFFFLTKCNQNYFYQQQQKKNQIDEFKKNHELTCRREKNYTFCTHNFFF